jgi:hypothetical protein
MIKIKYKTAVTKENTTEYLSTKNRYYIAGWCDGSQSANVIDSNDSVSYQEYLSGYADAKENNEYLMNTFGE